MTKSSLMISLSLLLAGLAGAGCSSDAEDTAKGAGGSAGAGAGAGAGQAGAPAGGTSGAAGAGAGGVAGAGAGGVAGAGAGGAVGAGAGGTAGAGAGGEGGASPYDPYLLTDENMPCDGEDPMTIALLKPLLPEAKAHAMTLAYSGDGGISDATLTLAPYDTQVVCVPKSPPEGGIALPPFVNVVFTSTATFETKDGVFVGTFPIQFSFRGGKQFKGVTLTLLGQAGLGDLKGSWKPSLADYPEHALVLGVPGEAEPAKVLEGVEVVELNFMNNPYSQKGKLLGTLTPKP